MLQHCLLFVLVFWLQRSGTLDPWSGVEPAPTTLEEEVLTTGLLEKSLGSNVQGRKKENIREARKPSIRWELETHRWKKSTSMCSVSKTEHLGHTKRCSLHSSSVPCWESKQTSLSLVERYNWIIVRRERQTVEAKTKKTKTKTWSAKKW